VAPTILITGATGYIGGRLIEALERSGARLRCMARQPGYLDVPSGVDVVAGDCLNAGTLDAALAGIHTAYYLVHSMGSTGDFQQEDRTAATNFGRAARAARV
jgi:uncharacterized protein YbjT (DUF2867 family)